jgi:tRNA 2-thiouridine synthesizing protein E
MATKTFAGVNVDVTEEGYMTDSSQWNKDVAEAIATEQDVELTEKHFEILDYIRNKVASGATLTIRGINKSGVVNAKEFYQMFPGAPLKKSTMIAGVPKPESCI